MKLVAARFRDQVHLRAARGAAFGGVHGGTDAEFGDRLERNVQVRVGLLRLLLDAAGINTIERIVFVIERPAIESNGVLLIGGVGVNCARRQRHQSSPVAAVKRDLLDLLGLDHNADFRRAAVERFRGVYLDHLSPCSYLQPGIDGSCLPDLKLHGFKHFRPESVFRHLDPVGADWESRHLISAFRICCGLAMESGRWGTQLNFHILDDCSRTVRHCAVQCGAIHLRQGCCGKREQTEN